MLTKEREQEIRYHHEHGFSVVAIGELLAEVDALRQQCREQSEQVDRLRGENEELRGEIERLRAEITARKRLPRAGF